MTPIQPPAALGYWSNLNGIKFDNSEVQVISGKGLGLVTKRRTAAAAGQTDSNPENLLIVPHDLVLDSEAVEQYAKQDQHFKQLYDAVGKQSTRRDVLLFLLAQLAALRNENGGLPHPWRQYMSFLSKDVLVPTLWTPLEWELLEGTSLEPAVKAKLSALEREFNEVQAKSSDNLHWYDLLWQSETVTSKDWALLDAWYRSRSLELPRSGEAMVPCLDFANHSAAPNAYYEETDDGVLLLLRPGQSIEKNGETTISYGEDKSAAEMLFSYGFVDEGTYKRTKDAGAGVDAHEEEMAGKAFDSLVLSLKPLYDDPLAGAKRIVTRQPPTVKVMRKDGHISWESPSALLMCLTPEDGLNFAVMRDNDGHEQLRMLWHDEDVTEKSQDIETLISGHPMEPVFKLRVATTIEETLSAALEIMAGVKWPDGPSASIRAEVLHAVKLLRESERGLLVEAVKELELQKEALLTDPAVVAYLGPQEPQVDSVNEDADEEEDDFS